MQEAENTVAEWTERPNRDQAMDRVNDFLKALHQRRFEDAGRLVYIKDMAFFRQKIHEALESYLSMIIEDEDWSRFEKTDLATEIEDPDKIEEELSLPEFSGRNFELLPDETVSLQIGMRGQVTPIRLHFMLTGTPTGYMLRLSRITAA